MIAFPKMHIAASTVNRILNVADELQGAPPAIPAPAAPHQPMSMDTGRDSGRAITSAMHAPMPDVGVPNDPGGMESAAASALVNGQDLASMI